MEWLPELDDDDLATLIEALEAWEHKDAAGEMFGDVVEHVLGAGASPDQRAQISVQRDKDRLARIREATNAMAEDPDDRGGPQQGGARNGRTPKLRIEEDSPDDVGEDDRDEGGDPDDELGDGLSRVTD